jgi:hypothetical protein
MTVKQWLKKITDLPATNAKRLIAGEITPSEAEEEEEVLLMRARLDLTDEQGAELLRGILAAHQAAADALARDGHPVSGNDPERPN